MTADHSRFTYASMQQKLWMVGRFTAEKFRRRNSHMDIWGNAEVPRKRGVRGFNLIEHLKKFSQEALLQSLI
jgi:hypothetical protein